MRDVVARLVDLPRADPDAPGPFRYADADRLVTLLAVAGLAGIEVQEWRGSLPIGGGLGPADAARFALAAFSSFGEQLAQAGAGAVEAARASLAAAFAGHQRDGAVRLDACVRIVTGGRR